MCEAPAARSSLGPSRGSRGLPARFFAQNAEACLADDLVHEGAIGWMESAAPDVTIEPLQFVALEHAAAPRYIHGQIDDLLGPFHAVVFGGHQLGGPQAAMSHAIGPIVGDSVDVGDHAVQRQRHLRHFVLQHGVVRQSATAQADGCPLLQASDGKVDRPLRYTDIDVGEGWLGPPNTPRTNRSAPAQPTGTTRGMYLSGTKAPSRMVSSERVARIPRTSHVGTMR